LTILVTGGAGFIGSNFVLDWVAHNSEPIINVDALTYAGNMENLAEVLDSPHHVFAHASVNDRDAIERLLKEHSPRAIVHFAAESHVDRSILGPGEFIRTNIEGTFALLEAARSYWNRLEGTKKEVFRFLQVSTDEVYGSLDPLSPAFTESSPYQPNSPYAASKAASDHLVRAWHRTYGLPTLITNCSNNYGPWQFPEKLVPLVIANALAGCELPIYGDGQNVRDWLFVGDHCSAIRTVLAAGAPGEVYNVGGGHEVANLVLVRTICNLLDRLCPDAGGPYERLITFVKDRLGHDRRYAIDAHKIQSRLGWRPSESLESGLGKTLRWYLGHQSWVANVQSGAYQEWIRKNYGER
jgi:dTDP-glucose 4,6-dehydratase